MDAIYYLSGIILVLILPALTIATIYYLIKPQKLNSKLQKPVSRKRILGVGLLSILIAIVGLGGIIGATEPESIKQARLERERRAAQQTQQIQAPVAKQEVKPEVKTVTTTQIVKFKSVEKNDSSIPKGEKRISSQGKNGERTITFEVTYLDDKETSRKEVKDEITKKPVDKITLVGTYVKPAPKPVVTNYAPKPTPAPAINPSGATAKCRDGTLSYSKNRRGTCSHHGGVAIWY